MDGEASPNQGSLRMREASELVGRWTVTAGKSICTLSFEAERIESANAWRLAGGACLDDIAAGIIGWRPAPDGIEMVTADRRTAVMFDADGRGRSPTGDTLSLQRAKT